MTTDPGASRLSSYDDLEDLTWVTRGWYRVLGYYFSIETNGPDLGRYIDTVIGTFATDRDLAEEPNPPTPGVPTHYRLADLGPGAPQRYRLYCDGSIMSSSLDAGPVFDHFFWHVNAEVARRTGEYVLIHAGAVGTPTGRGLLIPGASGTGKSTLVAGLLSEGYTYYSDEAAAIDPVGRRLHSYPKAITLKEPIVFEHYPDLPHAQPKDEYVRSRWYIVPAQIRSDIVGSPTDVGYIILSRFVPGAPTEIAEISRGEAALALGRSVINIHRYKARVLPLLSDLVADSECFSLVSGDLKQAVRAIAAATGKDAAS